MRSGWWRTSGRDKLLPRPANLIAHENGAAAGAAQLDALGGRRKGRGAHFPKKLRHPLRLRSGHVAADPLAELFLAARERLFLGDACRVSNELAGDVEGRAARDRVATPKPDGRQRVLGANPLLELGPQSRLADTGGRDDECCPRAARGNALAKERPQMPELALAPEAAARSAEEALGPGIAALAAEAEVLQIPADLKAGSEKSRGRLVDAD